jgi:outer membrane protein assembly factor BamB
VAIEFHRFSFLHEKQPLMPIKITAYCPPLLLQILLSFLLCPSTMLANDWPQWNGPNRDGLSAETGLLKSWPEGGPPLIWQIRDCGKGYAGPAIVDGYLYTLGSFDGKTFALALNAVTGSQIWRTELAPELTNGWGDGPRSTPTVNGNRVYVMTGQGTLAALRVSDGQLMWKKTMADLGGSTPGWGYCESVLVDGEAVLCTPGGEAGAVAALNKDTGELLWQSTEVADGAQYASIVKMTAPAGPQYIQLLEKRLIGLSTSDGSLLWEASWPGNNAVVPTPICHEDLVYVTSGSGAGCMLQQLNPDGTVTEVYRNKLMKNQHGGAIRVGTFVYGYSDSTGWLCQDLQTGKQAWRERDALGKGAIGYADGMLYCLDERTGTVVLIEASPEYWIEQGRLTLEPQSEIRSPSGGIWVHPVIANGKLYLRDQELLFCYDVKLE